MSSVTITSDTEFETRILWLDTLSQVMDERSPGLMSRQDSPLLGQ